MVEKWLVIPVMEIVQPLGTFYIGKAFANDVTKICSVNKRRKEVGDELDKYIGMQRELNQSRKKQIQDFVLTKDASFPSSIILAVKEGAYKYDADKKILKIKEDRSSCNVIDGQHRLSGFPIEDGKKFELILTIFLDLDMEYQSYLFSVINTTSSRINPSLSKDLYEFSNIETPEKLAHRIARVFNITKGNPWFRRLKLLGKAETEEAILSQATFTVHIVNLISNQRDAYKIRDILMRNNNNRKALLSNNISYNKPLWDKYVNGDDKYIYDVLKSYFMAAENKFKGDWGNDNSIITKTAGYTALMNVLYKLLKKELPKEPTVEYFSNYFKKIPKDGLEKLDSDHYEPGQKGESKLKKDILKGMGME
ncbi:MAG: DGQHR domain-containing protein [Candidatus Micrarchaeota archaeon]|nr:DGQHR domain-containing protein [Candidatus Micrarchaeota archaeon]